MPQHSRSIEKTAAADFLTRCFHEGETIAILLRQESPTFVLQRVLALEKALSPRYLHWMAEQNAAGANVYVGANPLRSDSRKRTKESIAQVRHLYIDIDMDGENRLAAIRASDAVPIPNVILSTSADKYQVLWRVEGFGFELQERTLKLLSFAFGGDPACTDCNRVLRVPGFLNQKYSPAYPVTAEYLSDSASVAADFQLEIATMQAPHLLDPILPRKVAGKRSNSELDWAWVLHELERGKDPVKLTRTLAQRRTDKPNPLYYAQRTVDVASARLWLVEGVPIADVVTMLEVRRRFELPAAICSTRARDIALSARRMNVRNRIA
jgi:hypothetical protein